MAPAGFVSGIRRARADKRRSRLGFAVVIYCDLTVQRVDCDFVSQFVSGRDKINKTLNDSNLENSGDCFQIIGDYEDHVVYLNRDVNKTHTKKKRFYGLINLNKL